ncbi:MAG: DUF86 domain-containing protein [bacterium]|jgi:uncharacterized protein YutE (UPF0331/DUF86 family)|nr:DUF86 domain-containing protein [bacterium]
MEVDKDKLTKLLSEIRLNVERLQEIKSKGKEEFVGNYIFHSAALHILQLSIESMISIGNHIISRRGLKNPKDFADVFKVLAEANVVKQENLITYQTMARFRNRIVHIYWDVDLDEVYNVLENNLVDFNMFINEIANNFFEG